MDVVEVLPHELAHLIVVGDRLKSTVDGLVASCGPLMLQLSMNGHATLGISGLRIKVMSSWNIVLAFVQP